MKQTQIRFGQGDFDRMTMWWKEGEPGQAQNVILVVHGLTEHIGRYEAFAQSMTERGCAVAGFDIPGHGGALLQRDGAPRPAYCGGEGSWRDAVELLDRAAAFLLRSGHKVTLLGFSLGSFLTRAWAVGQADRRNPTVAKLLLLGTGDQNTALLRMVRGIVRQQCGKHGEYNGSPLVQNLAFGSYNRRIKGAASPYAWLLTDERALAEYERDGLCYKTISCGLFRELLSCMIYVNQNEGRRQPAFPAVFLSGQCDPVGENGAGVKRAAKKFPGAPVLLVPGRHDILHDAGCENVFEMILQNM